MADFLTDLRALGFEIEGEEPPAETKPRKPGRLGVATGPGRFGEPPAKKPEPKIGLINLSELSALGFAPAQDETPSFFEAGTAFGQGATAGAVKGATTASGAILGAESGAAVGAMTGPFAPAAVPVLATAGGLGGAIIGYKIGEGVQQDALAHIPLPGSNKMLAFENVNAAPHNIRPYLVAGESFGSTAPFIVAPYVMSASGIRFSNTLAGNALNSVIRSAESSPKQFLLAETAMALGSAGGAGAAQAYFPGSAKAQFAGEVVGGFLNPGRYLVSGGAWANAQVGKLLQQLPGRLGEEATKSAAGGYLKKLLDAHNVNPEEMAKLLRQADPVLQNQPLTAGQKTNSAALLALEHKLSSQSSEYGADSRKLAEDGLITLKNAIKVLGQTGDPKALKVAAALQDQYFKVTLNSALETANAKVRDALAALKPDDPVSRAEFGRKMAAILEDSTKLARQAENELWDQVDTELPARVDNILAMGENLKARVLPEEVEEFPSVVLKFLDRKAGDPDSTIGELLLFRRRMLALSRQASSGANPNWNEASIYSALAEAALDDLTANADMVTGGAIDAARAYSRIFNETFSQTFAGDALKRTSQGGLRLDPELVAKRALGSGAELGELQFRQLAEAAKFAGQEQLSQMLKVQQDTLRFAANRLMIDGTVNAKRLLKWRTDNRELLARFPELDQQLADVQSAQKFLDDTQSQVKAAQKSIAEDAAFARLVGGEDPARAVARVLSGDNPIMELNAIRTLAQTADARVGPGVTEAQRGLETAIFNFLVDQSTDAIGNFSFATYAQTLKGSVTPSSGPLAGILVNAGIVTQKSMDQLFTFLERAQQLEAAMASGRRLDEMAILDDSMLFDFMARTGGAKLGAYLPGRHSLIAQAAGARLARQVLDQIPRSKVKAMVIEATKNPELMALLLEQGGHYTIKQQRALQLNAFLLQAGLVQGWGDSQ
jgi:hypothetical protein